MPNVEKYCRKCKLEIGTEHSTNYDGKEFCRCELMKKREKLTENDEDV